MGRGHPNLCNKVDHVGEDIRGIGKKKDKDRKERPPEQSGQFGKTEEQERQKEGNKGQ